jgi:hypothetical protein
VHKDNLIATNFTRENVEVAANLLMSGLASLAPAGDEAGLAPAWAQEVHVSHSAWHGAGLVFCKRCGSVGSGYRQRHRLFAECRAAAFNEPGEHGTEAIPHGSKTRLARTKLGRHPEPKAKLWPDGRKSTISIRMVPLLGTSRKRKADEHETKEIEQRRQEESERRLSYGLAIQARRRAEDQVHRLTLESAVTPGLLLAIQDCLVANASEYSSFGDFDPSAFSQIPLRPTEVAAGIGIGIDRLSMIMTNSDSIRDVLFFPQMKPE